MGCTSPCDLIESASSLKVSVRMSTRGWHLPRCSESSGKLAKRSPASTGGSTAGAPARFASRGLNSARPRPKDGFLPDMTNPSERCRFYGRDRLYGRGRQIVAANHLIGGRELVAANHLTGERQIGKSAARFLVVKQRGLAETRRLRQPYIAGDHGAKHLVAEVLDQLRGHFIRKVVARVEHGAQQTFDFQIGIDAGL